MKTKKLKYQSIVLLLLLFTSISNAQSERTVLDEYIQSGIDNNLVLQQRNVSLEKAMMGLQEAQSLFLPTIALNASYTTGQGGRFINLPLGDLLNPVYQTLNLLTQTQSFPTIENTTQNFFPNNQNDIHVRTSVAVWNSDLKYNRILQQQQISLKESEVAVYKRELVFQIKQAYFNYLMAIENARIYENALQIVQKNVEINESLLANGKGLPAKVLRSKSEYENVAAQWNAALTQQKNAVHYFNFLLNKSLDDSIIVDESLLKGWNEQLLAEQLSVENREELKQIGIGMSLLETQVNMNKSYRIPKISAFADLGTQSEDWKFNKKSLYYLVGIQLDVPLFNASQKFKISKSKLDIKNNEIQLNLAKNQLELSLKIAQNDYQVAVKNYASAQKQEESAASYFRLIEKGYKEGVNTLIEYLDARNQLTNAKVVLNIQFYKILQAEASVERQAATYTF